MGDQQARRLRAYRFALDPTRTQVDTLKQHAGAARWAFNHALAAKLDAHRHWKAQAEERIAFGIPEKQARREATSIIKVPSKPAIQKAWNQLKGDETTDTPGVCPWWRTVSTHAFQSAFIDADRAWQNWMDSLTGKRAGRRVGQPRFKKKGRARDSFRLHHDTKKPTIRLDGYRRLIMPRIGSVRLHDSGKRMARALTRGGIVQSVTVARGGRRWYASVLVDEPDVTPGRETQTGPSPRQVSAGTVGVDLGTKHLAVLSTGEPPIDNPRHLRKARARLLKAQQAVSRTQKGSARRRKAAARLGRIHHEVSEQRSAHLHGITKKLATKHSVVAIEDLNVAGMTRSAKGTVDKPGKKVKQKSGLNRSILDVAPGEFRRQLEYKTRWYGSQVAVCDRWFPSSKTCSACGAVKTKLSLSERVFTCDGCGFVCDRDVNAAHNIAAAAQPVASGAGETINARGERVSPESRAVLAVLDEAGRPGRSSRSPRGSDPPVTPSKT